MSIAHSFPWLSARKVYCHSGGGVLCVYSCCHVIRKYISDTFALHSGYNGLAEENDIIMLYPQVTDSLFNPKGCWDW